MAKRKEAKSIGAALGNTNFTNCTLGHRENIKLALRIRVLQLVEEYISEAEHSDGEDYWDQFPTSEGALKDFVLCYHEILRDDTAVEVSPGVWRNKE